MQKVLGRVRRAADDYKMIEEGDRIAVAVSGGKDSMLLLGALAAMRRFYKNKYELYAITVDLGFFGEQTDYSQITGYCESIGVEHHIKRSQIGEIIFDIRKGSNPCSLCAKMRRGALHDFAKELNCNKIALGHHADDAAETFIMNLFIEARVGCYSPVTYLSRKDITMIRPLSLMSESEVRSAVKRLGIPVVKNKCPADHEGQRQKVKSLLKGLEKDGYYDMRDKIVGAMRRGDISGWKPFEIVRKTKSSETNDETD